ncbi:MAG: hypothetical protein JWL91_2162 [Sphingomonas bacterium]|nr:hypothetical protein [Sphingomonas bacterium]MDB5690286.1 hypothetical protein [Sphingomonas bacterium]
MLTAGKYFQKRREAAALSIDDVAERIVAPGWGAVHLTANFVREIEADRIVAEDASLTRISERAFPVDRYVYRQLVAGLAVPALCRVCACSWMDACIGDAGPCAWAEPDLCTACVSRPLVTALAAPNISDLLRRPGAASRA